MKILLSLKPYLSALIIPSILFFIKVLLKYAIPKVLNNDKSITSDLGYFYREYNSHIANITFNIFLISYFISFFHIIFLLSVFNKDLHFFLIIAISLLLVTIIFTLVIYYLSKYLTQRAFLKKKINLDKVLAKSTFRTSWILAINIQTLFTFFVFISLKKFKNTISLESNHTIFGSLLLFGLTVLFTVILSVFFSRSLYKDVIIYINKKKIHSYANKKYIHDTDLDEGTLLLLKIGVLRTNIHLKKLLLFSEKDKQALFIPQDTLNRLNYIQSFEDKITLKKKESKFKILFQNTLLLFHHIKKILESKSNNKLVIKKPNRYSKMIRKKIKYTRRLPK